MPSTLPEFAVWYSPLKSAHIGLVLVVYLFTASVALSHHPLGFLQPWWAHGD